MGEEIFIKRAEQMKEGIILRDDEVVDEQCERLEGDPIGVSCW